MVSFLAKYDRLPVDAVLLLWESFVTTGDDSGLQTLMSLLSKLSGELLERLFEGVAALPVSRYTSQIIALIVQLSNHLIPLKIKERDALERTSGEVGVCDAVAALAL